MGGCILSDSQGQNNGSMAVDVWKRLGEPKFVVAPMVDASELAWRMLCRKHGAQLCFTPMLHSSVFVRDPKYRADSLATCPEDKPLIVQFCANDPDILLKAATYVECFCDCVDINLGCPQSIAKRGHYGAFLQDDWDLLTKMVKILRASISIPVSCKVRIFPEISKSVEYARMLVTAGCQLLTVHGRTREQKGPMTGVASWAHIKAIKEAVIVPVIANGNIQCFNDVTRCLSETGCDGVMSAEGNLHNPAIFEERLYPVWELALEYLNFADIYPCPLSYTRGHLFKLFQHLFILPENMDLRDEIARGQNRADFLQTTLKIKERYAAVNDGEVVWSHINSDFNLSLPPWICQPWVRMAPEDYVKKMKDVQDRVMKMQQEEENSKCVFKRVLDENTGMKTLSKKKQKKLLRRASAKLHPHSRQYFTRCLSCPNPVGLKCENELCKTCCRTKCNESGSACVSHRIKIKSKKEVHPRSEVINLCTYKLC